MLFLAHDDSTKNLPIQATPIGCGLNKMASRATIDLRNPSEVYDDYWIWESGPEKKGLTLGKWLIFKHKSAIDKTWETVRRAVASGELGATGAKVSTMRDNSNAWNPDMKVICVYTTAEDVDAVGLKLIPLVRQTIRYKTDEATLAGVYANRGFTKTTCRTLEWNNGSPKFK